MFRGPGQAWATYGQPEVQDSICMKAGSLQLMMRTLHMGAAL